MEVFGPSIILPAQSYSAVYLSLVVLANADNSTDLTIPHLFNQIKRVFKGERM